MEEVNLTNLNIKISEHDARFEALENKVNQILQMLSMMSAHYGSTGVSVAPIPVPQANQDTSEKEAELKEDLKATEVLDEEDIDHTLAWNINSDEELPSETVTISLECDHSQMETNTSNNINLTNGDTVKVLHTNLPSSSFIGFHIRFDHLVHNPWFGLVLGTVVQVISILRLKSALLILSQKELFEDLIICDPHAYHWN